ncbi:MAG: Fic family protein [Gemmatimonadetes bacterium]|nr:Fic family protein [Gemmatimonadota bacterium]
MLFRPTRLDSLELSVVDRIEQLKESLRYAVGDHPKRWQGLLRRTTFARAIRGSNSIEGYNVTVDDAIAAAEGEEPLDATAEAWAAVQGYRAAMTYVLQLANDPHFTYSTDLLRALHFMMIQYDLGKHPGRWRPGPIYVRDEEKNEVVYEGPDADLVPDLMTELVATLNQEDSSLPAVVRAAMGHLNLVMIHPFSDGNGRMARCLQTLIVARAGILASPFSSIEEYLGRNTRAYYDVLADVGAGSWHAERDTRPWIRFCLTAHFRQAATLLRRSREMARLWSLLEVEAEKRELPDRLLLALADAAAGFRVRNATYRPVAEVSEQVASRDLRLAVEAGLLTAHGERRGRYYTASPTLQAIRERVREPRGVPDPFTEGASPETLFLPGLEKTG